MNTIKKLQNAFIAAMVLFTINSCVKDDDWSMPPVECNNAWTTDLTMEELFAMADAANGEILSFDQERILEGYVVSSDSTGNFFKTMSIQNKLENPTRGLQVEMDRTNLFNNFPLGSRVQINLKGLNVAYDRGMLKIGETYTDNNGNVRVGRMMDAKVKGHVVKTCDEIAKPKPVVFENIEALLNAGVFNTLVTIKNIQFDNAELGKPYAETNQTVDRLLIDNKDNTIKLRNSGYASFASEIVPEKSGSITVVLNGYDQNVNGTVSPSEYQLYIRDTNDVQFNDARFGDTPPPAGNAEFVSCLNETFNAFAVNNENFPNYENLTIAGTRKWRVKDFSGNKYIEASAFQATGPVVSYFVVPVDFSKADAMSFKTKDGHNNGNVLKVYYSTNYTPGGNINNATLVDITSNFTIASGTTNGYANDFTESGVYNFNQLSGNGVVVFAYEGNGPALTTTMQLDDIQIIDNEDANCGSGNGGGGEDPTPPSADAKLLFPGSDFENWGAFLAGINDFGLKPYATQGVGLGQNGSHSLHIQGTPVGNDYVFTSFASSDLPTTYSKISFFVKGTSAKSVSLNVYRAGEGFYAFNLGNITSSTIVQQAENNQYTGSINTNGEWVQITLDLTGISDLNVNNTNANLFALKIGKEAAYDLHFDNFVIE